MANDNTGQIVAGTAVGAVVGDEVGALAGIVVAATVPVIGPILGVAIYLTGLVGGGYLGSKAAQKLSER